MKRLIFLIWLMMIPVAQGDFGYSVEGNNAEVTLVHTSGLDSAWVIFTYNSSRYDSIKLVTAFGAGSRYLEAYGLDLDSIGTHNVEIRMFTGDAFSDTLLGTWLHENPNLITSDVVDANVAQISGSPTAADGLEEAFDGDATGAGIITVVDNANMTSISGSVPAADSAELVFLRAFHSIDLANYDGATPLVTSDNIGVNWADVDNQGTSVDLSSTTLDDEGKYGVTVLGVTDIAAYRPYTVRGVIEDSSGNTAILQQTNLASTTNDIYLRQQIEFLDGNNAGYVTQISDYIGATGVISLIPGLPAGTAAGDSFKVTGNLIGLMANVPDTVLVNISGNAAIYADSVLRPPQTMVAEDTVTTGDSIMVKSDSVLIDVSSNLVYADTTANRVLEDSASYQGAAGSLTLEGVKNAVWGQVADSAFAAGSMGDSAKGWGATGAAPGGSGAFSCSLFAYNSGWSPNGGSPAITSGNIRMISGVNDYTLPINADGWAIFSLDGGTWTSYITALRFLQDSIPQTFTFAADYVDTLTMTSFGPGAPSGPNMVNAYINTWDLVGDTVVGAKMEISLGEGFGPPFRDTDSNLVLIPRRMVAYSDTLGLVQKSIWKSSKVTDIRGRNITYNFKITKDNYFSALFQGRTAPDSNQWKIK